ncbi:MAG TPA: hypothetical protein VLV78_01240 [Thermoanaerobaculia bacterium]|nr:hypothetical protein [Thermoanaerobaculia bacterium]
MRKVFVALVALLIAANAMALDTKNLLATIAMPLAVAAVSNVSGVPQDQLANLVVNLNQANVPPTQFVEVIRYVPVALIDQNGQPFIAYVEEQRARGVTGDALVTSIVQRLQSNYSITPTLALTEPATTVVVRNDYIPTVITTRLAPADSLSFIALPLAVAAVADIAGVPQDQLANLVATLNNARMPAPQMIEIVRYVPVALVDNGPQFVQFVQDQTAQGITGPALAPVVVRRLQTYYPAPTQINVTRPATVILTPEPPPVVFTRVTEVRQHPQGGPPGQLKKQLGLQTGAEVVHGEKPGRGKGKGHGNGEAESPMVSGYPSPAPVRIAPQGRPPAVPPGQMKEQGGNKGHGQGHGKGKGKD